MGLRGAMAGFSWEFVSWTELVEILAFPPIRRRARNGWGTQILRFSWGFCLFRKRFELGEERGVYGAAIELGEAEVAVESDAGEESFAGCGVKRGRQRTYSTMICRRAAGGTVAAC